MIFKRRFSKFESTRTDLLTKGFIYKDGEKLLLRIIRDKGKIEEDNQIWSQKKPLSGSRMRGIDCGCRFRCGFLTGESTVIVVEETKSY